MPRQLCVRAAEWLAELFLPLQTTCRLCTRAEAELGLKPCRAVCVCGWRSIGAHPPATPKQSPEPTLPNLMLPPPVNSPQSPPRWPHVLPISHPQSPLQLPCPHWPLSLPSPPPVTYLCRILSSPRLPRASLWSLLAGSCHPEPPSDPSAVPAPKGASHS